MTAGMRAAKSVTAQLCIACSAPAMTLVVPLPSCIDSQLRLPTKHLAKITFFLISRHLRWVGGQKNLLSHQINATQMSNGNVV